MNACIRLRPFVRNLGLFFTAFCAVVGVSSTLVAYFNVDGSFPRPKLAAFLFAILWSLASLLGIWLLLLYYKYRLFIDNLRLRQKGVLLDRQFDMTFVDELKWRRFPAGGSVRLSGISGILKIELGNFNAVDRERLVTFLRHTVSETRQTGWQEFNERFTSTPVTENQAARMRYLLMIFFGTHSIAFAIMGANGAGSRYFAFSAMNALMVVYLLWKHRRNRSRDAS